MRVRIRRIAHRDIRQILEAHIDNLIRYRIVEDYRDLSLHNIRPGVLPVFNPRR